MSQLASSEKRRLLSNMRSTSPSISFTHRSGLQNATFPARCRQAPLSLLPPKTSLLSSPSPSFGSFFFSHCFAPNSEEEEEEQGGKTGQREKDSDLQEEEETGIPRKGVNKRFLCFHLLHRNFRQNLSFSLSSVHADSRSRKDQNRQQGQNSNLTATLAARTKKEKEKL